MLPHVPEVARMSDATRRWMRSEEYQRYVDIAADARSAAGVLYDQGQSFDDHDGARAQASAVWHDDPTLFQPRRTRRISAEIPAVPPETPDPPESRAPNGCRPARRPPPP